ncbi:MAG: transcriptional repressor [Acidobacteria bacterium]|nr:transcriptional repressor [Acidobacteriota bacterium]
MLPGKKHEVARQKLEHLETLCKQEGIPVTVQRRVILETLLAHDDHPTADDLFAEVRETVRGVSRTTVYRVLDTLVRVGLARRIAHPGAKARFDANTERHHHLVCTHCDRLIDVHDDRLADIEPPPISQDGFVVQDFSLQFYGVCSECSRGH